MLATGMEDTLARHPTGHVCDICHGIAVVDMDHGIYLCAVYAIEATVTIDLRAADPILTIRP